MNRRTLLQPEHAASLQPGQSSPTHSTKGKNAMAESINNDEVIAVLKEVVNSLQDSQKGFADIGEQIQDPTLKRYFLAESLKRARFHGDLEAEPPVVDRGGKAVAFAEQPLGPQRQPVQAIEQFRRCPRLPESFERCPARGQRVLRNINPAEIAIVAFAVLQMIDDLQRGA